jgi:hypothetical protein
MEYDMKPKTFTYNQMIQFFQQNKLPLTQQQVQLVGIMVKAEIAAMEQYKAKKKAQADKKFIQREKRKEERKAI